MYIINKFDKALTTLLVGNNVTKIAGASVFTILATDLFRDGLGKSEDFLSSFQFSMICSVAKAIPACFMAAGFEPNLSTRLLKRCGINEPDSLMDRST